MELSSLKREMQVLALKDSRYCITSSKDYTIYTIRTTLTREEKEPRSSLTSLRFRHLSVTGASF